MRNLLRGVFKIQKNKIGREAIAPLKGAHI